MYRRPGAHKAKAAPSPDSLVGTARGGGDEVTGEREKSKRDNRNARPSASGGGGGGGDGGGNETEGARRDEDEGRVQSPPRLSVHTCLPALPALPREKLATFSSHHIIISHPDPMIRETVFAAC